MNNIKIKISNYLAFTYFHFSADFFKRDWFSLENIWNAKFFTILFLQTNVVDNTKVWQFRKIDEQVASYWAGKPSTNICCEFLVQRETFKRHTHDCILEKLCRFDEISPTLAIFVGFLVFGKILYLLWPLFAIGLNLLIQTGVTLSP